VNRSMKLIHYSGNRLFIEVKEIADWERPPMAAIPAYLARHRSLDRPSSSAAREAATVT
jgi:hypothetical protein